MHVAIDLDDVCMEFYSSVLKAVKKEYGVEYLYENVSGWDKNELKESLIFGEGRTWWDWLRDRDWLWAQFPAVEGAIGGIATLRQQGHYVEAVTSKPDWARWTVWAWLGKWRPDFHRVTIVSSGQEKSAFTDADILVDDSPSNIIDWQCDDRVCVIYDRPWNQGMEGLRAYNWADVLDHVASIEEAHLYECC